ncbi:MAG: DUF4345 family protein [Planctomycetota bacterium]|nr:DUF4345 family protein [Planctomycetota bacterium]
MAVAFLWINAVMYLGFSVWCTVLPTKTAEAIGFAFSKASGKSEYVTIYGGLEMGLALFFLFTALSPSLRTAGLLFALVLYGCLALWRIGTVLSIDELGLFPYVMLSIEVTFTLIAAALYFRAS